MLSDEDLKDLATKMDIPLEAVVFKDELLTLGKLKHNRCYIINMENEFDENGERNTGSHWTCFQVNKYPSGLIEGIYFDSYGQPSPKAVTEFCGQQLPHTKKDIQSLMADCCGWYCLAFLHYINSYEKRSKDLYVDTENFLSLFHDLEKSVDWKYNEYVLKHFFRSSDPEKRMPITVHNPSDISQSK